MNNLINQNERKLIRREIKKQIILNEGIFDSLAQFAGNNLKVDNILPDTIVTSIKKYLLKTFLNQLGITTTHPLADFIQNLVANMSISDLTSIFISRTASCPDVGEAILKAATQTLTTMGIRKLAVPIVHFFTENSFDIDSPNFIKNEKTSKAVSINDVNSMLDSMIGVLGETLISKIIYAFIKDAMVPVIQNQICSQITGSSAGSTPSVNTPPMTHSIGPTPTAGQTNLQSPNLTNNSPVTRSTSPTSTAGQTNLQPPNLTNNSPVTRSTSQNTPPRRRLSEGNDINLFQRQNKIKKSIQNSLKFLTKNEVYLIREYYLLINYKG